MSQSSEIEISVNTNSSLLLTEESLKGSSLGNSSNYSGIVPLLEQFEYIFDKEYVRIIFIVLYSIVFCFCFFGNLAVVLVVTIHPKMRCTTRFCLGNLAFADLCVGIFCVYQNLSTYLFDRWLFGSFLCKMYHFINSLSHTASILILVVICVERYLAILHPFKSRQWLTLVRLRIVIVSVWFISAILCSPRLYFIDTYTISSISPTGERLVDMICAPQLTLYDNHIFDMAYFILLYFLPLIGISYVYIRVGIYLWRGPDLLIPLKNDLILHSLEQKIGKGPTKRDTSVTINCGPKNSNGHQTVVVRYSNISAEKFIKEDKSTYEISTTECISIPNANSTPSQQNPELISIATASTDGVMKTRWNRSVIVRKYRNKRLKIVGKCRRNTCRNRSNKIKLSDITFHNSVHIEFDNAMEGQNERSVISGSITCPELSNCVSSNEYFSKSTKLLRKILSRSRPVQPSYSRAGLRFKSLIKSRQSVVRMLVAIVLTFTLCNLPFHVRKLCQNYLPNYDFGSNLSNILTPVTFLLMYTNCAVNPIIFAFMSKSFRSCFMDLLKCKRSCVRRRTFICVPNP